VIPRAVPEHFSDEFLMIKRCHIQISLYVYFTYFTYGHSSNIKDINMIFMNVRHATQMGLITRLMWIDVKLIERIFVQLRLR